MGPPKKVCYYFHPDVVNFHYGPRHPMKPQRLAALHSLVLAYDLDKKMDMRLMPRATPDQIMAFHDEEYVKFLHGISPNVAREFEADFPKFNIGEDCPIFDGIYDFCSLYTGGSLDGAMRLNHKMNDIVVNWAGGLHHAKKREASGFCYINDIVIAILELLKHHRRVLYIDIDIHHGDGVQEAFYFTDRVMTLSLHRYGNHFFPGTGDMYDWGDADGRLFSVNVPLREGITDFSKQFFLEINLNLGYTMLFKKVMDEVMCSYQPEAIVLQCGADSLGGDRLGCFNLSFDGHAECVDYVKKFQVPMMVLGGGGYTLRNVARCWANETGVLLGEKLVDDIPENAEYLRFFAPDFTLRPKLAPRFENANSPEYLAAIQEHVCETLRLVKGAPSVQMQPIPPDVLSLNSSRFTGWGKLLNDDDEGEGENGDVKDEDPA
ncbi:unnamed protein product, partial [Mesorhabditis spiculigera]